MKNGFSGTFSGLRRIGVGTVLFTAPALLPTSRADDCRAVDTLRAVGAMQAWMDQRSGLGAVARPDPNSVELDRVQLSGVGTAVYRVTSNIPHAHPYLLVCTQSAVVRLGGFPDPALRGISVGDVLGPGAERLQRTEVADALVRLMDDNGAYELLDPSDTSRVSRMWRKGGKAAMWSSADTIVVEPDGSWFARRTVLSRNVRSYARAWNPLRLALWVSSDGKVEAWSLIRGEAIPGSGG